MEREPGSNRENESLSLRIVELARIVADADSAHLEVIDFDAGEVEVVAASGDTEAAVGSRVPYPGSLSAAAVGLNHALTLGPEELARSPVAGVPREEALLRMAVIVPLIATTLGPGAMILFRRADRTPFTSEDVARMAALGDLGALVLQQSPHERLRLGQQSEDRFRLLVESVKDYAIFMLDVDGQVVSWNEGARRIKGYSEDEIVGAHFSIFYTVEDRERGHPWHELESASRQGVYQEEGWRVRKDGTRIWAHVTITAMRDEAEQLVGFAKVTRDLTERRRAEEEAQVLIASERRARVEAEDANRAKSEFLATMSHELRTPLNAIVGYADLLDAEIAGPLTDTQRGYLGRVRGSSGHLISVIGDVLDMARLEAGRIEVNVRPTRASEAAARALEMVQPQARAKSIALTNACSVGDVVLQADPERLQQILVNLLGNAVKFTERGGRITLTCGRAEVPAEGAALEGDGPWGQIRIQDTGIGIPAERMESIWRPFEQVETGHTRAHEGAGLGLAISRSLVRRMGGDLVAHSDPGVGSTFIVVLAAAAIAEADAPRGARERRGDERRTVGIAAVGDSVLAELEKILRGYLARLRTDPGIPSAAGMSEAALEDHAATLLVDIAEALHAVEEAAGAPSQIVRDAQEIQHAIAERHGQSRARSGWRAAELRRDYAILREELERAVRRRADETEQRAVGIDDAAVEHGLAIFARFLDRAEQTSLTMFDNG